MPQKIRETFQKSTRPSGWFRGLVVGWMEVSMAKKALADLFQTQVSLTPSVFIRDMTNLITV